MPEEHFELLLPHLQVYPLPLSIIHLRALFSGPSCMLKYYLDKGYLLPDYRSREGESLFFLVAYVLTIIIIIIVIIEKDRKYR